jgi:phage repressor protein C with HTH and peptisase S24 domain
VLAKMNTITLEYFEQKKDQFEKQELVFSSSLIKSSFELQSLFVIKVEGHSMEPLIQNNSLVVADLSQKEFEGNAIFLVYKNDRMWIKKAALIDNQKYFVSLNHGYEHLVYPLDEVRVVAKVLLTFTSL